MTMVLILIPICLIILLTMQLSYGMRPYVTRGIIVFGIGIPEHANQAEELESLRASFRQNNIFFIVMGSLTLLPMFALNRYFHWSLYTGGSGWGL